MVVVFSSPTVVLKSLLQKRPSDERRTGDEQRSSSRRADGAVPSEMRAARGSYHLSARTESGLKTGKTNKLV